MTLDQFGIIINVLGLFVPLVFSISIAQSYPRRYFRFWTLSYLFYAGAIGLLTIFDPTTVKGLVALGLITAYQAGSWFLLKAADSVEGERASAPVHRWLCGITWGLSMVSVATGRAFDMAVPAAVLFVIWTHLVAARKFWQLPQPSGRLVRRWLASLLAASGVWVLAFPFITGTPWGWIGYAGAGTIHMLVGMQMVVYLIQDVAATLATQNEALQQVDRLKTNFIGTVSHELRTPVTAIKSAAWLLDSPKVSPDELKGIITQQTDALSRIVSDMLDVSLIDSGAMTYQPTAIDLVELIDESLSGLSHLFEAKGIALHFEHGGDRPTVTADADRLKQVLANLLVNALKFTPEGGWVAVSVEAEGGQARVAVADNGQGVPEGLEQKIFERFYQVDNSATRKVGGAGLGLAISKAIVEDGHGGRIWAEGAEVGSRFVFQLPLARTVERRPA